MEKNDQMTSHDMENQWDLQDLFRSESEVRTNTREDLMKENEVYKEEETIFHRYRRQKKFLMKNLETNQVNRRQEWRFHIKNQVNNNRKPRLNITQHRMTNCHQTMRNKLLRNLMEVQGSLI